MIGIYTVELLGDLAMALPHVKLVEVVHHFEQLSALLQLPMFQVHQSLPRLLLQHSRHPARPQVSIPLPDLKMLHWQFSQLSHSVWRSLRFIFRNANFSLI